MPLPWKKTRGNRISRIVADLQPPKRGGSLVVETGFPTSVIDLFVKNRDRMKRQSPKKNTATATAAAPNHFDPYVLDAVAPPPTPLLSPDYSSVFPPAEAQAQARRNVVNANCFGGESAHVGVEESVGVGGGGNGNGVFVKAVKMFLVVVLALSTKKLVVGITLSAFLLLFLECFGKFAVGFLKPCSDAQAGMSHRIRKIFGWFLPYRESKRFAAECDDDDDDDAIASKLIDRGVESSSSSSSSSCEEIRIQQPNFITSCHGMENEHMGQGFHHDYLSREKRWGCLDMEEEEEEDHEERSKFPASKNQRSKSAKLKAKLLRKLIPKKLRSGKKLAKTKKMENKTEVYSEVGGHQMRYEAEEQDEQENENGSISSCGEEEEEEEEDGRNGVAENGESAETIRIGKKKKERKKMEMECIFVVGIILSGLLGGRLQAMMITISGCFLLKLMKILNQTWKLW